MTCHQTNMRHRLEFYNSESSAIQSPLMSSLGLFYLLFIKISKLYEKLRFYLSISIFFLLKSFRFYLSISIFLLLKY